MKFKNHIFSTVAIMAIAFAVVGFLQTKPLSNASAAVSSLQEQKVFTPDIDTYVASGSQWENNPRGNSPGLFVGYGDSEAFDLEKTRTFLRFDLTALKNKVITGDATLRLYLTFVTFEFQGQTMDIEVRKVTGEWNEQATWHTAPNEPPLYESQAIARQVINTDVARWVEWKIGKQVIEEWINNPAQNYGLALVSPDGERAGTHIRNFTSRQHENTDLAPQLIVSYVEPTPTPTPTPTPRLSLRLNNDPLDEVTWGDKITYTISYSNTSEMDIPLTNVIITGSIPSSTTLLANPSGKPEIGDDQIVWRFKELSRGNGGQLSYIVEVDTATRTEKANTMRGATATPSATATTMATATESATSTGTLSPTATATPTSLPSKTSTSSRTVSPTPLVIINCVEGSSNETSLVRVCAYNGGEKLWLPLILSRDQ